MKKIVSLITVLAVLIVFSGCAKSDAKAAFEDMMQAFQTGSAEEIEEFYSFEDISKFIDEEEGEAMQQVILSTLTRMSYEIEDTEKIDSTAVKITARVTTTDFSAVMEKYMAAIMELVSQPDYQKNISVMRPEQYQKLLADKMAEIIQNDGLGTEEKTVSVTMVKENNRWKPGGDKDDLIGELFGDLTDAVNSLI